MPANKLAFLWRLSITIVDDNFQLQLSMTTLYGKKHLAHEIRAHAQSVNEYLR